MILSTGEGHAWPGGVCGRGDGGHAWWGGHAWLGMHGGGVHGRGACVAGGHAWLEGACMAWGHAWQGGMRGQGGVHGGGCVTCMPPGQMLRLQHMVNERVIRILLECILVFTDQLCEIVCRRSFHLLKVLTMRGNPRHVKRLSDYNFRSSYPFKACLERFYEET